MMLSINGKEAKVCLDGKKLLTLLGLSEEDINCEDGAVKVRDALLSKTDEEREEIFKQSAIVTPSLTFRLASAFNTELENVESYYNCDYNGRDIEDIKKDLKRCKNYMQRKVLQQELNIAYRAKKRK